MISIHSNHKPLVFLPTVPEETSVDFDSGTESSSDSTTERHDQKYQRVSHNDKVATPPHNRPLVLYQTEKATERRASEYVNSQRHRHGLEPLERSIFLDNLACLQARYMARRGYAQHSVSTIAELQALLHCDTVGENVQSGVSVASMFQLQGKSLHDNIVGDFNQFGMATAKGKDGKIYLCQLFRKKMAERPVTQI